MRAPSTTTAALPSRRVALASLAGFGAAIGLPKIARAAALADSALIAHSQKVADLAQAELAACMRIVDHEEGTSPRYRVSKRRYDRAERRLDEAVASKTAAVVTICGTYEGSVHPEWLTELAEATLRDVLAVGGAA